VRSGGAARDDEDISIPTVETDVARVIRRGGFNRLPGDGHGIL